MQTIRTRLTIHYWIVLFLGMSLTGILAWLAVERLYLNTQRENLLAQANILATALQDTPLEIEPGQPYSQFSNVMPGIHTRLLNDGGAVIVGLSPAQEYTQAPAAENYASIPTSELIQRPEIESALRGTPTTAIRRVLGSKRVLYAAAPRYDENGAITGIVYIATPLPAAGLPTDVLVQLIAVYIVSVLLAAVAGRLLAQQIARPLEALASAAMTLADGNLQQRVESTNRIRELDHLSQSFNHMVDSLRRSDDAKKEFIADVTHELRTPLTVIKGTIETLEDGAIDDIEGRGPLLGSMQHETDRLIRLVNELLTLTRADAGALQLNKQSLDLGKIARTRCDALSSLAARKRIVLNCKVDDPVVQVYADPDRLSQIMDNLLDNAIRHAPERSTIAISIQERGEGTDCSVADHGSGIPAEHLPRIFDRFYRVDRSRTRKDGGTGLGLAIVKALVQAHGGRISAQSSEGAGTTITFWLPKAAS